MERRRGRRGLGGKGMVDGVGAVDWFGNPLEEAERRGEQGGSAGMGFGWELGLELVEAGVLDATDAGVQKERKVVVEV